MKRIALLLVIGLMLSGCATIKGPDITIVENATYQEVIVSPGKSQQQLFEKSKQWLALTFVSSKKVIEYENITEGRIIGNGSSTVTYTVEGLSAGKMVIPQDVLFTMIEDIKDGKVRLTINNVMLKNKGGVSEPAVYAYAWEQLKPQFMSLCSSLNTFLNSPGDVKSW